MLNVALKLTKFGNRGKNSIYDLLGCSYRDLGASAKSVSIIPVAVHNKFAKYLEPF
jgi:hypothetical protein